MTQDKKNNQSQNRVEAMRWLPLHQAKLTDNVFQVQRLLLSFRQERFNHNFQSKQVDGSSCYDDTSLTSVD